MLEKDSQNCLGHIEYITDWQLAGAEKHQDPWLYLPHLTFNLNEQWLEVKAVPLKSYRVLYLVIIERPFIRYNIYLR